MKFSFSSESVTEGHPDKLADQISDAILDAILTQDPQARVACECLLTTGLVFISGEITTRAYVDIPKIARQVLRDVGYTKGEYGFDADSCSVLTSINEQSPDIAMGVDTGGAGDQGMMFGYASNETESFMPLPVDLAHQLTRQLAKVRHEGIMKVLRPDGKAQVTVRYEDHKALGVERVVLSAQHDPDVRQEDLRQELMKYVIQPVLKDLLLEDCQFFINPTGSFIIGGPPGDCGLTGRKIIVDTYGGMGRHGGGCFSGKDPSKVDRSGAYMARYLAKNLVASGLAQRCEIQIAYAIGVVEPVSFYVNSFGTGTLPDAILEQKLLALVDLSPAGIRDHFDLCRPLYQATATYGHFGRKDQNFPWEKLDLVQALQG